MAIVKGIRKRWMLNSISAVLLIVLFAVAAFSAAITSYFYSTMSIGLNSRITSALPYFSSVKSRSEYYQSASNYVQNFTEKNRLELQIINPSGSIYESTNDLTISGSYPNTPDVTGAIEERKQSSWSGTAPVTGERIMSVSAPIVSRNGTLIGVIRMVTSLSRADIQVVKIVAAALAVGATIVLLVYFSNLYFVRSIVEPVTAVTDTAKRIAAGSYGIQMEKKYDDEVGDLIDAVNDMSMKIKQSEKMKSEFISSVSHELRTPLTAINGWAETIMNGEVRDASDVKKGMGIIVSEARRLTNMVELEDAVYTYTEFFRREGITLTHTDCEEEFPPIPGDPERMRQVFCNLLDNAAKHGGSGKRIDTAIRREGDAAVITIRDYGPGIPEEELPHVKYKFYKGSSKARGSGIGLAVCEEIVTRHNGRLDIGNAEGGGCIVTIRLPIGS